MGSVYAEMEFEVTQEGDGLQCLSQTLDVSLRATGI